MICDRRSTSLRVFGRLVRPSINVKLVAPSRGRVSGRLIREALDWEVSTAAPFPIADAVVDLLYGLLAESLFVRGEERARREVSIDRLGSAGIPLKIRPGNHRLLRGLGDSARRRNATEIFAVAAALAEHWCKVLPICIGG